MNRVLWILCSVALTVALGGLWLFPKESPQSSGKENSPINSIPLLPGENLRADWPPEEVFRRAFWQHPGAHDRIVEAVRFESSAPDGVSRWVWFMKIHPSAELLRRLRDPSTFGLLVTSEPKLPLPGDISPPDWFPRANRAPGVEILQHPSQNLTLRYEPKDNLLYASDHGKGFAKGLSN